jgi:homocysteine S-methyltransferase
MEEINLKKRLAAGAHLLMDGGMGSEIEHRGFPTTLPLWSAEALLTHPDVVRQIHKDYIRAGADIIITDTFRTTRRAFAKKHMADQAATATALACQLARQAIGSNAEIYIAGSIAPLEDCYSPELTPPQHAIAAEYDEIVAQLKHGKVDFILLETMITSQEALSGISAAKKHDIPFAVSFCCNDQLALLGGEPLHDVVRKVERFAPIFIGVNCISIEIATKAVKKLRELTNFPISVYAQGDGLTDDDQGWKILEEQESQAYVQAAQQWLADGAQIIGGCCGTTPAYIQALRQLV